MTPDEQIKKILDDNRLKVGWSIGFPQYNIVPDEIALALKVLENHKMVVTTFFTPIDNENIAKK